MTNNSLARVASVTAISDQEERIVFGVMQMVIERMNDCLHNHEDTEFLWSTGAQKRKAEENDVSQYSDSRKELFRQRFSRLKNNVISHKNCQKN